MQRCILLLLTILVVSGAPAGEPPTPSSPAPTEDGSPIAAIVDYRFTPVERFVRAKEVYSASHPERSERFVMVIEPLTEEQQRSGGATLFYEPGQYTAARRRDEERSFRGGFARPDGTCDSNTECKKATDNTCKASGYEDGVCSDTVSIITRVDGNEALLGRLLRHQ